MSDQDTTQQAGVDGMYADVQLLVERAKAAEAATQQASTVINSAQTTATTLLDAVKKAHADAVAPLEATKKAQADAVASLAALKTTQTDAATALAATKVAQDQVSALLEQCKTKQSEILALSTKSTTDSAKTAEIARIADAIEKKVSEYEKTLVVFADQFSALNLQIKELLPGATGVGLAKSFNARKASFAPIMFWSRVFFLLSCVGFIAIGAVAIASKISTFTEFLLYTLERIPIIVGLILIEEFSRRMHNNAMRMEEDYAYKEALSLAFDGYQKAMATVDERATNALSKQLATNILAALNQSPGRLVEAEPPVEKRILELLGVKPEQIGSQSEAAKAVWSHSISALLQGKRMGTLALWTAIGAAVGAVATFAITHLFK